MADARPSNHSRSKSSFSFRSNKSDKSDSAGHKPYIGDLHETEKERKKSKFKSGTTKDPNSAIRDVQPSDRIHDANTMPQLRSMQYKDWRGDAITDPDVSNPTRPRMERPLDTIRSFEAAIDSEWKRKSQMVRSESADFTQFSSRRNSYVGGNDGPNSNRYSTPVNGYGRNRSSQYNDHYAHRPGNPRYQTSPMAPQSGYSNHPSHGYSQSYDTVDTGGTSSSEPWANSTDPSSENSSIERAYGMNGHKPEYQDAYGQHRRESPRHDAIQEEYGFDGDGYTQGQYDPPYSPPAPPRHSGQYGGGRPAGAQSGYGMAPPPAPPTHQPQRNVIPLSGNSSNGPARPNTLQQRPPIRQQSSSNEGKRKSWLKRRFSKGS